MDPSAFTLNTSPTLTTKTPLTLGTLNLRNGKPAVQRVDLEPIYTQLKSALGEQWADYKVAVNAFVLGNLSQAELSWVLQPLLSAAPSVITATGSSSTPVSTFHLHNSLISTLYANTQRDPPSSDVASWVVATDKPTSTSKGGGAGGVNDKADERLKREAQGLHARDRKRLKTLKDDKKARGALRELEAYHHELAVKPLDNEGQGTGGRNWDLEVRRRYAQNLASETLEFPTQTDVLNRLEPICYEEGLTGGAGQASLQSCSELVEQALEVFLKEALGQLCEHTRSNGEGWVQTHKYKRQLHKEEEDAERGVVQRNAAGLLPVEMEAQAKREPLNMEDLRVALHVGTQSLRQDRFLAETIMLNRYPDPEPSPFQRLGVNGFHKGPLMNGTLSKEERDVFEDGTAVDNGDRGWNGTAGKDQDALMGVLDDCLAVG